MTVERQNKYLQHPSVLSGACEEHRFFIIFRTSGGRGRGTQPNVLGRGVEKRKKDAPHRQSIRSPVSSAIFLCVVIYSKVDFVETQELNIFLENSVQTMRCFIWKFFLFDLVIRIV
ncbi:hypothetical protein CDAR_319151 [Caerostris darwini]|uniref:Uncharacterized protein n=1 Tax=Caerostris darwini TaxID=1538125 RepID=A0AAV4TYP0_9ARAC|nr:hypothetical protein CDAR_319151 [Caerostris darwini]